MCLLTNERYKTYQTGFSFPCLGHAPGVGLGGTVGGWVVQKNFFPKFNQIWCVSNLHQWHMQQHNFLVPTPWGPGEWPEGQISLNLNHKVNFEDFLTKLCVSSHNWKIWNISDGISFRRMGHAPGVGLGGTMGGWGSKFFFPKFNQIWCVSYLHEWHMQRHNFLGPRLLGPWGGAKRSNIIKSQLQSQFQRFLI